MERRVIDFGAIWYIYTHGRREKHTEMYAVGGCGQDERE
jgi:hypothetical protein